MRRRIVFVVLLAGVGAGTGAGCNALPTTPEGFRQFEFTRIGLPGTPDVRSLSIERLGPDRWEVRGAYRERREDPETCGGGEDCYRTVTVRPRSLTPAERERVDEVFQAIRWELEADSETCPLWDPAYIDTFRWDGFTLSNDLCRAPYLVHQHVTRLHDTLFPLLRGPNPV